MKPIYSFFKRCGLTFLLVFGLTVAFDCSLRAQQPNFLVFIADDVSVDDIGAYGNEVVQTPNIDQLARNGMRFDQAFLTISSCSPSRTSIMSGRWPHNTGSAELHTPLPEGLPLFPEDLKKAGYYTVSSGKWHLGDAARRGFDRIVADRERIGDGGEEDWLDALASVPDDTPFFGWFAAIDAHRAWGPNDWSGTHKPASITPPVYLINDSATRVDLARYYDEIKRFDVYIGKVVQALKEQGMYENTVIVVMADNGRPFPRCKTRLYDSGLQTPFIVHWPAGIKESGQSSQALISAIDLAPTLLHLAGVEPGPTYQGKSFHALFDNPGQPFRNYVYGEHNWHDYEAYERMVRTPDHLYILNQRTQFALPGPVDAVTSPSYQSLKQAAREGSLSAAQVDVFLQPRPKEELYDLQTDTHQVVNLAGHTLYSDVLERMRNVLHTWQQATCDDVPEQLTPSWFDYQSYDGLAERGTRGTMPGSASDATTCNAPGPF